MRSQDAAVARQCGNTPRPASRTACPERSDPAGSAAVAPGNLLRYLRGRCPARTGQARHAADGLSPRP